MLSWCRINIIKFKFDQLITIISWVTHRDQHWLIVHSFAQGHTARLIRLSQKQRNLHSSIYKADLFTHCICLVTELLEVHWPGVNHQQVATSGRCWQGSGQTRGKSFTQWLWQRWHHTPKPQGDQGSVTGKKEAGRVIISRLLSWFELWKSLSRLPPWANLWHSGTRTALLLPIQPIIHPVSEIMLSQGHYSWWRDQMRKKQAELMEICGQEVKYSKSRKDVQVPNHFQMLERKGMQTK